MVQNQLIDYISAQLKAGTSRDAIKSALTGAGWQAGDVDDTMKKIDSDAKSPAASVASAQPMTTTTVTKTVASGPAADIIGGINPARPAGAQSPIRVGDFDRSALAGNSDKARTVEPASVSGMNFGSTPAMSSKTTTTIVSETHPASGKGGKIMMIIEIILILALAGLSIYLYMENESLSGKVATLGTQGGSVASQVSTLTSQVATLTASNATLVAQVASLTSSSADLATNLSFFVAPQNSTGTITGTVTGVVSLSGSAYTILTDQGVKLMVKNSTDPATAQALSAVAGTSAQFAGTYVGGTRIFTVTMINGVAPQAPASATTTATTTNP